MANLENLVNDYITGGAISGEENEFIRDFESALQYLISQNVDYYEHTPDDPLENIHGAKGIYQSMPLETKRYKRRKKYGGGWGTEKYLPEDWKPRISIEKDPNKIHKWYDKGYLKTMKHEIGHYLDDLLKGGISTKKDMRSMDLEKIIPHTSKKGYQGSPYSEMANILEGKPGAESHDSSVMEAFAAYMTEGHPGSVPSGKPHSLSPIGAVKDIVESRRGDIDIKNIVGYLSELSEYKKMAEESKNIMPTDIWNTLFGKKHGMKNGKSKP